MATKATIRRTGVNVLGDMARSRYPSDGDGPRTAGPKLRRVRPDAHIDACTVAHRRLLATVDGLTDQDAARPSLLEGWTRGHVITHLARNAASHVWLFEGANAGEVRHQYPREGMRAADIEAGAGRAAGELRADLERTCDELEWAWTSLPDELWDRDAVVTTGQRPLSDLVFRRWREVEVHHVDLGLGYSPADWP